MTLMPRCWLLPRDGVPRLAPYNASQATLAFAFVFDVAPLQANGVSMSPLGIEIQLRKALNTRGRTTARCGRIGPLSTPKMPPRTERRRHCGQIPRFQ